MPDKAARYAVRLRSKHTGKTIILGWRYDTYEEALKEGESECLRCNSVDVLGPLQPGSPWYQPGSHRD